MQDGNEFGSSGAFGGHAEPAARPHRDGPPRAAGWRVVKVGGSLLDRPGLARTVVRWLDAQPALNSLLICGGGELADQVRALDRRYRLTAHAAHFLAIQAMQLNGFVLSRLIPDAAWMDSYAQWARRATQGDGGRWFFAVEPFMRREEPSLPGVRLPAGWHVTSDSIAARIAAVCRAQELVLLKSTLPAASSEGVVSIGHAVAVQLVDDFFPQCAARVPRIRAVNLRDPGFTEVQLRS